MPLHLDLIKFLKLVAEKSFKIQLTKFPFLKFFGRINSNEYTKIDLFFVQTILSSSISKLDVITNFN